LVKALNGQRIRGIRFLVKRSYGHRAGLILRGSGLSSLISDGDPDEVKVRPRKIVARGNSEEAGFTAAVLNEFLREAHLILKEHPLNKQRERQGLLPANYLLVRGPGFFRKTPSFKKRYKLKAVAVAGGTLYKGIARILGMDLIEDKRFTGKSDTNLEAKVNAAKKALEKRSDGQAIYDFCYLHIKATDTFCHDGDFRGKRDFIERVDKALSPLLKLRNCLIVITGDHATCSKLKRHCQEPVPVLIWGDGQDSVANFSERACKRGSLGKIKALELMPKLCQMLDVKCKI
jgi:2,3-bisphosphoglycerate-independent phosphoglycerate mutase